MGSPSHDPKCERFWTPTGQFIFNTIEEVKEHATNWLWSYNNERPNMGIGGSTPAMKLKLAA